jgi:predicted dehydrogenase
VFDDYAKMLDSARPDVVVIAGPFELHAEMAVESMRRGIHVFCEKPVAMTMDGLERLRTAHSESGVRLAGMMGLRYEPAFYTAWRAIKDGAVGTVRMINTRKSYKLGERPPHYHRRETYGGTIPWVGSHAIDWLMWLSGESFVSVHAMHTARDNRGNGDMEMTALCQFSLTNDVFGSVSMDFLRPANAPTHGDDRARIAGTEGVIEVRDGSVFLVNAGMEGEVELPVKCDRKIFRDFIESIEGNNECLVGSEETFELTRACLLARQSADENRIVQF